ncbi:MAG TPA: ammonia-forming cytochrome c nitrite reductase subunit c552, partial [Polyangiales bacterium]|nr:ammonia-forming cytochrome c nitrite reductase subunit c552 [Polyangiales bacterium]
MSRPGYYAQYARIGSWLALVAPLIACSDAKPRAARDASVEASTSDLVESPEIECGACHEQHVQQWRISSHAYALKDPVFRAMVQLGQKETHGVLGPFCVACHSPIGNLTGQTKVTRDPASGEFSQNLTELDAHAQAGVTCRACHGISRVNIVGNAGFELKLDRVRRGPIDLAMQTPAHSSEYSPLFEDTELCGTCHVVVNQKNAVIERTHIEWVRSEFNGQRSCQDCHMPSSKGPAARGGPERTLHDHRFVGVDVSLLGEDEFPGYAELREKTEQLLRESAKLTLKTVASERQVKVDIQNLAGHALPSGATADRELWVELIVRDAQGKAVFESGTLDERGDLRTAHAERTTQPGSDPQLVLYT